MVTIVLIGTTEAVEVPDVGPADDATAAVTVAIAIVVESPAAGALPLLLPGRSGIMTAVAAAVADDVFGDPPMPPVVVVAVPIASDDTDVAPIWWV